MNRFVKLFYTTAIASCPKSTQRGLSLLQKGNTQTDLAQEHLCRRNAVIQTRNFSSAYKRVLDEKSLEEDAERKIGWLLKLFFAGTATVIGYHLFPYMGENVMQQSVKLLQVKDPLFKRMGASRLARFSIDDKRRMKIVELGGAQLLVDMLAESFSLFIVAAILFLSHTMYAMSVELFPDTLPLLSDAAEGAVDTIYKAGAIPVIKATLDSIEYEEVGEYKTDLLARLEDLKYDTSS
ncbi:hypothetical protein SASPL_138264 [Salvia splendens]|uniref:Uncharacterized protein n=1 Tax=Salvia splendens TaxID=180675 RepID=A0A8X8WUD8_SALSN|nr:hypothetical protein SASPL_138264 [Salvia splendens]